MDREKVSSSTIRSIGYSEAEQLLEIEFTKRTIYEYYKVPANEYTGLMNAKSHGIYFNTNIKDNYKFNQIK
jgi:hypothetical protein